MRRLLRAVLIFLGLLVLTAPAAAGEKRVALVIGNAAYQKVTPLRAPVNEAKAIAEMLKNAGFGVVQVGYNLANVDFRRAVREFAAASVDAEIAVVYYSGHGMEVNGANYLVPIDATLVTDFDTEDEAIAVDRILAAADNASRLRLIILDAGRDNPFAQTMQRTQKTRGLARINPGTSGTLIVYASRAGTVFAEPDEGIGPFAAALVKHLPVPGLDLRIALGAVRDDVMMATLNRQEPFVYGSLGGAVFALVPADIDVAGDFESAKQALTRTALEGFITRHVRGLEVDQARNLLRWMDRDNALRQVVSRGKSYALVVGNSDYRDAAFGKLDTPLADAGSIAEVLTTQYGFITELTRRDGSKKSLVLLDRPGRELLELLDDLEEMVTIDDRLLIFYAGHGNLDDRTGKSYWIPVDAGRNRRSEWISSDYVVSALKGINARSILVVADSCFSGTLFRAAGPAGADPTDAELESSLFKDAERSSRVLIASGGTEPVLDGGGDGHSIFARKFLDALKNPMRPIFSARELHLRRLKPTVAGNAKQVPQYDWLRESGHDAGDFIFVQTLPAATATSKP